MPKKTRQIQDSDWWYFCSRFSNVAAGSVRCGIEITMCGKKAFFQLIHLDDLAGSHATHAPPGAGGATGCNVDNSKLVTERIRAAPRGMLHAIFCIPREQLQPRRARLRMCDEAFPMIIDRPAVQWVTRNRMCVKQPARTSVPSPFAVIPETHVVYILVCAVVSFSSRSFARVRATQLSAFLVLRTTTFPYFLNEYPRGR